MIRPAIEKSQITKLYPNELQIGKLYVHAHHTKHPIYKDVEEVNKVWSSSRLWLAPGDIFMFLSRANNCPFDVANTLNVLEILTETTIGWVILEGGREFRDFDIPEL